ncbi:MAG: release factor glutamine methyltransferase [Bacteroidia bacterium]
MATKPESIKTVHSIANYQQRRIELAESDSAALDVDLLISHVLDKPRVFLYAHPEQILSAEQALALEALLERRRRGEPIAHLTGRSEFWSLPLRSTAATLIPRPDTECLVEAVLELYPPNSPCRLLDLGTGTGAIALALASERPNWDILAVDVSYDAVSLAKVNARSLGLEWVCIEQSDWFAAMPGKRFDIVVSNPPYIEENDAHLLQGDLRFEPHSALVAGADGLSDIRRIIRGAVEHLVPGGALVLEHGYLQADVVAAELAACGFSDIENRRDYGDNARVSFGRWTGVGSGEYSNAR